MSSINPFKYFVVTYRHQRAAFFTSRGRTLPSRFADQNSTRIYSISRQITRQKPRYPYMHPQRGGPAVDIQAHVFHLYKATKG